MRRELTQQESKRSEGYRRGEVEGEGCGIIMRDTVRCFAWKVLPCKGKG